MKCPNHSKVDVVGYCYVCGAFGCPECLTQHEGELYCAKHYRSIGQRIEKDKKQQKIRRKHPRQRLVVAYADSHRDKGVCFALNIQDQGFPLDLVDESGALIGKQVHVRFEELKAVFFVKSFDGNFDTGVRYPKWTPEGADMVVEFKDGEVIRGISMKRYSPNEPRFRLNPSDPGTNNISVLIEAAAVKAVYMPEKYEEEVRQKREARKQGVDATLSQEETTGDFYFGTRYYPAALEQYELALSRFPHSGRLRKKALMALYNIGIQHIRRHEYDKALAIMERVLAADPHNKRVLRKVRLLRHALEKAEKADAP